MLFHGLATGLGLALGIATAAGANDSVYFTSGNQLIPMVETEISVARERLALVRDGNVLDVSVAYEFQNPGPARTLTVGFEAPSPEGDVQYEPVNDGHPYMRAFTVEMNGQTLPYRVDVVPAQNYYAAGTFQQADPADFEGNPGLYVYHFQAPFQPGRNTVTHTYSFDLSAAITEAWSFDYILTAANRWAGGRIGDFELTIDMGPMVEFQVDQTFFADASDWRIEGVGAAYPRPAHFDLRPSGPDGLMFALREGRIVFRETGFRPAGELVLWSPAAVRLPSGALALPAPPFDAARQALPFALVRELPTEAVDAASARILRNYLFARRGYVFRNAELRVWFTRMPWYLPDPDYVPDLAALPVEEQAWFGQLTAEP